MFRTFSLVASSSPPLSILVRFEPFVSLVFDSIRSAFSEASHCLSLHLYNLSWAFLRTGTLLSSPLNVPLDRPSVVIRLPRITPHRSIRWHPLRGRPCTIFADPDVVQDSLCFSFCSFRPLLLRLPLDTISISSPESCGFQPIHFSILETSPVTRPTVSYALWYPRRTPWLLWFRRFRNKVARSRCFRLVLRRPRAHSPPRNPPLPKPPGTCPGIHTTRRAARVATGLATRLWPLTRLPAPPTSPIRPPPRIVSRGRGR